MTKFSNLYFSLLCFLRLKKGEVRPWGGFEVIQEGTQHQTKRIWVESGKRLSLQSHQHRSEVWIVVSGTATVERNEEKRVIKKGGFIDIPLGARHRLANEGGTLLVVIEVQNGDYLEEDDITRYQDDFNRC